MVAFKLAMKLTASFSAWVAWPLQVTEIDSLIGEPAVWQEHSNSQGQSKTGDSRQVQGVSVQGMDAGTQTDDVGPNHDNGAGQEQHLEGDTSTCMTLGSIDNVHVNL